MRAQKINPRQVRQNLGLNQEDFWTRIGVTQSGGSRYETGRGMPKPVQQLLRLVHIEQLDLDSIRKDDIKIIEYLKTTKPALYKSLKKTAEVLPAKKGSRR